MRQGSSGSEQAISGCQSCRLPDPEPWAIWSGRGSQWAARADETCLSSLCWLSGPRPCHQASPHLPLAPYGDLSILLDTISAS